MNERKIKAMADRVARRAAEGEGERDKASEEALKNVDQAVDAIIAAIMAIDENLPNISADTVPQKAALDEVRDLMNEAVKPYFADVVTQLQVFEQ